MPDEERTDAPVEEVQEATEDATEEIVEATDNALDKINEAILELRGLVDNANSSIKPLEDRIVALEGKTEEVTAEPVEETIHELSPIKKHWAEKLPKWF